MHMRSSLLALVVAGASLLLPFGSAMASNDLLELKNTILSLVDQLVQKGVLSAEEAEAMKRQAAAKAREESQSAATAGQPGAPAAPDGTGVVRVPYVPDIVKDEIRAEVREELRQDVTNDVVAVAKAEKWGTADALPEWLSRIKVSGDLRLRAAGLYQQSSNYPNVPDIQSINEAGGFDPAGVDAFLNTTEDTNVGQVRLRLGTTAAVTDNVSVVARLATGNDINPTTRNQRLGTYNQPFDVFVDLAYGEWHSDDPAANQAYAVRAGRLPNPFTSTSLLFDDDLTFDGVTGSYRRDAFGKEKALFVNLGGFSLLAESPNLLDGGTNDKYWWGAQAGLELDITDDLALIFLGSYYDFINVVGRLNQLGSTSSDWTAPAFIAKGNTVFDIRAEEESELFALASDFELLNAMVELSYRGLSPVDVVLRVDYVTNVGFDGTDVESRVGRSISERNQGWFAELEVGSGEVRSKGDWQVFAGYKSVQRDAVLDSFTDSDFHAGGTDAEGWLLGGSYGIARNLWLRARWLSADEIDGAPEAFESSGTPITFSPLAIDILQVDLNARF